VLLPLACGPPVSPACQAAARKHLAEAQAHSAQGRTEPARRLLTLATRQDPALAEAHSQLGLLAYQAGNPQAAVRHLLRATRLSPSATCLNNLGAAYAAAGQLRNAVRAYRQAVQADTSDPTACLNLVSLYQQLGRLDAAEQQAYLAYRLFPEAPRVALTFALALALHGKPDRARQVAAELPTPLPGDCTAIHARLLHTLGQHGHALTALRDAVARSPRSLPLRIELATVLLAADGVEAALTHSRQALALAPRSAAAHALYGETLLRHHEPGAALPHLELAVQQAPLNLRSRALLGEVYVALGKDPVALHRTTVQLAPTNPMARRLLADALMLEGRYRDAARAYRRAIELGDRSADTRTRILDAHAREGNLALALSELADAAASHADDPGVQLRLATFCASRRDAKGAADAFRKALALAPDNPKAHIACGNWHRSEKRFYRAADHYQRSIALDATDGQAHLSLADVLLRLRRRDEARQALAKARPLVTSEGQKAELEAITKRLATPP